MPHVREAIINVLRSVLTGNDVQKNNFTQTKTTTEKQ